MKYLTALALFLFLAAPASGDVYRIYKWGGGVYVVNVTPKPVVARDFRDPPYNSIFDGPTYRARPVYRTRGLQPRYRSRPRPEPKRIVNPYYKGE